MVYKKGAFITTERVPAPDGSPGGTIEWLISQEELGNSGKCFTKVTVLPGAVIPTHQHKGEFEVFYVISGEGDYIDDDKTIRIQSGDVMYCEEGHMHGLINNGSSNVILIAFIGYGKNSR